MLLILAAWVVYERVQRTQVKLTLTRGKQVKLNTVQRTQVETNSALGPTASHCNTVQRTQVETNSALGPTAVGPSALFVSRSSGRCAPACSYIAFVRARARAACTGI